MKNRKKYKCIFIFLILFFIIGFFSFNKCLAKSISDIKPEDVVINEIMWMGSSISTADEWIELRNLSSRPIDFSKNPWSLFKNDKLMIKINKNELKPKGYYLVSNNSQDHKFSKGKSILNIKPDLINSSLSLSNNNVQYKLYNFIPDNKIKIDSSTIPIDIAGNKSTNLAGENGKIKKSMERNNKAGNGTKQSNWHTSCQASNLDTNSTDLATPKAKNSNEKDCQLNNNNDHKKSIYIGKIKINEIYPSPNTKAGETEFIEIKNISSEKINLKNWSASDSINKRKSLKENYILKPNQFYVFQGKFSLNSSNDSAKVFDGNNQLVTSLSYGKGKSKYAYAFDGSTWRWTSHPTPDAKNKFDKILFGKIKKDKDIYQNIYAHFKVNSDKDVQKFTWEFGDGHKSYLKNTRHKYAKTGNYQASLRLRGNGEEHIYTFTVKVKKYKVPKIRIVSFSPNPKGRDSKNEWIKIKNKSRKKVNLKNWFITTGWKKRYNHSIKKDFKIRSKKIKKLTRQDCAFSLNNTRSKIELKSPDKKTVQKIKYQSKKNKIAEDEIYKKVKKQWTGIKPPTPKIKLPIKKRLFSAISPSLPIVKKKTTSPIYLPLDKKYFTARPQLRKNIYSTKLSTYADYAISIQTPATLSNGFVLGAQRVRSQDFYYFSTYPTAPPKYWATKWAESFWIKINSHLNQILYKIFE